MNFNNLAQGKHNSRIMERSMEQEDECHNTRPGEQISIKPLQDKDHHGEILKTMKGAQGLSRMSRLEEQKDGEIKEEGVRSATEKTSHS
jgi:hypothetical protein